MTEIQHDLLIGYLDALIVLPYNHPKAEAAKEHVLELFDSMQDGTNAGRPMQPADFRVNYLIRCRAALDNCEDDCKKRLIKDFSQVYYYFAAGEKLPIYMRYMAMFDIFISLNNHVRGGDFNAEPTS